MSTPPERAAPSVDPKLLEILVCPVTKGPLEFRDVRVDLPKAKGK